jgi:hypothetical protein
LNAGEHFASETIDRYTNATKDLGEAFSLITEKLRESDSDLTTSTTCTLRDLATLSDMKDVPIFGKGHEAKVICVSQQLKCEQTKWCAKVSHTQLKKQIELLKKACGAIKVTEIYEKLGNVKPGAAADFGMVAEARRSEEAKQMHMLGLETDIMEVNVDLWKVVKPEGLSEVTMLKNKALVLFTATQSMTKKLQIGETRKVHIDRALDFGKKNNVVLPKCLLDAMAASVAAAADKL